MECKICAKISMGGIFEESGTNYIITRCRRRNDSDDDDSSVGYSVAVSNSLLKEESFASKNQPPCMNCVLIEMGEMVCYSERCPDCGRWKVNISEG